VEWDDLKGFHVDFVLGRSGPRCREIGGCGCVTVAGLHITWGLPALRSGELASRLADCRYCELGWLGIVVYSVTSSCWPQNAARLVRRTDGMSGQTDLAQSRTVMTPATLYNFIAERQAAME
jgi:hypothetical protein